MILVFLCIQLRAQKQGGNLICVQKQNFNFADHLTECDIIKLTLTFISFRAIW